MDNKSCKKLQKVANEYICKKCDYYTNRKSSYIKHLNTNKHQMITNDKKMITSKVANELLHVCVCGKSYKFYSGLSRHKNNCINITKNKGIETGDSKVITNLLNENIEMRKLMMEQQQQISELIPRIGNNNNNTIKNKFNLNVFLNETCKDAMTLTDFVNNLEITLGDLEMVGEHGYMKGLSDIFVNGLRQMEINKRPIHCSDLKRETLYIKNDELDWKKEDTNNPHVTKAIRTIHHKNFKQIRDWKCEHPYLMVPDHPDQHQYMKIVSNCMEDSDQDTSQIIKTIAKEAAIYK